MMRKEPAKITQMRDHRFAETFRKEGKFVTKSITATMPMDLVKSMMSKSNIEPADSKVLVMFSVEMAASLKYYGVKNVVIATDVYDDFMRRFVEKYFGYKYMTLNDIRESNMKFDSVLANPPYDGKRELHQHFFNKAVEELVVDGGTVCFVQPSTPYDNKKPEQRTEMQRMRRNVKTHTTNVQLVDSRVFENADIATQIAITLLVKDYTNSGLVETITYKNGDTYKNINIDDINYYGMAPSAFRSIVNKIATIVDANGSIRQLEAVDSNLFYMQRIRGHVGTDDFYTIISRDSKYHVINPQVGYGYKITEEEIPSAVSYFKTFIARFALSIYKFNIHNDSGNAAHIPLVDFNQEWSDDKLMAEWGITEEEYAEILKVIPAYYD